MIICCLIPNKHTNKQSLSSGKLSNINKLTKFIIEWSSDDQLLSDNKQTKKAYHLVIICWLFDYHMLSDNKQTHKQTKFIIWWSSIVHLMTICKCKETNKQSLSSDDHPLFDNKQTNKQTKGNQLVIIWWSFKDHLL